MMPRLIALIGLGFSVVMGACASPSASAPIASIVQTPQMQTETVRETPLEIQETMSDNSENNPYVDAAVAQADPANWRKVDPENLIVFNTSKGQILIEIFDEVAPNHGVQFRSHVRSGDYDGTVFHRVIDGFMAQGGDITVTHGRPSPLPNMQAEFTFKRDPKAMPMAPIGEEQSATNGYVNGFPLRTQASFIADMMTDGRVEAYIPHCAGTVSTARTGDPNSANAQFFLMRGTSPHLDQQYTAWGTVRVGLDVVFDIKKGDRNSGAVRNPDVLLSAKMAADMGADAPEIWVQRTDGPAFAEALAGVPANTNVCDLPPVPVAK